ncbi:MAG: amidophosphoribosyltransferase [Thermoplasmataceae archaeon]
MAFQLQESDTIDGLKPSENCAVVGFLGNHQAFPFLLTALKTLQHRGQESAGIATFDGSTTHLRKGMGLVAEVFSDRNLDVQEYLRGTVGIGHTRYSTAGSKTMENAGPFLVTNSVGSLSISHNGEITNANRLRDEMMKQGSTFLTSSDTEVMLMLLSREIVQHDVETGIKRAMERLKGAYAVTLMLNDRLFALRDPYAFRPLCIGEVDGNYVVASESCALDIIGARFVRDLAPGEAVEITKDGPRTLFTVGGKRISHCMFEYVYFARPDSIIDGIEVFQTRIRLGRKLAKEFPVSADVVVGVPDSGRAQALGYALESGIPYSEGLIKNKFSERTFIMPTQEARNSSLRLKLNVIKSEIDGKRVVLVDDSIVRGNTMHRIVGLLRGAGAREVHVRVGSPQIVAPCYFGVDMKTKDQFIAAGKTLEQIRAEIGADSLGYVSIEGLVESIGMRKDDLCLGCLTGKYPQPLPDQLQGTRQSELETFIP